MRWELPAFGANLQLIAAAHIDAAVAAFRAIPLYVQFEILELLGGHDVRTPMRLLARPFGIVVLQIAMAGVPFVVLNVPDWLPTFEILTGEKRSWLGPFLWDGPIQ